MSQTRSLPTLIIGAGIIALIAGIAFSYLGRSSQQVPAQLALVNATPFPRDFRPIAEFQLTDYNGQVFSKDSLKDHWSLVFFGFTHCPDICPMTLAHLQQTVALLPPQEDLQVVFVSVDPERDLLPRLKEYVRYFNPRFLGVTGDAQQLQTLASSLGVFYKKAPVTNSDAYSVDHSASIFLINPKAKVHALLSTPHDAKAISQDFLTLTQHYESDA